MNTSLQTVVPLPDVLTLTEQLPEEEDEDDEEEDDTETEEEDDPPEDELDTDTLQLPPEVVELELDDDEQLLNDTLSIEHSTSEPPEPMLGISSQDWLELLAPILM